MKATKAEGLGVEEAGRGGDFENDECGMTNVEWAGGSWFLVFSWEVFRIGRGGVRGSHEDEGWVDSRRQMGAYRQVRCRVINSNRRVPRTHDSSPLPPHVMEPSILQTVGQVAGIGGLAIGVFLVLFKEVIRKNIFPQLGRRQAHGLIQLFMILTFVVALAGLGAWLLAQKGSGAEPAPPPPSVTIEFPTSGDKSVACELSGQGGAVRVRGTSRGLAGRDEHRLLMLVDAPSPGPTRVVQLGRNGIDDNGKVSGDGSWAGTAQVGRPGAGPEPEQEVSIHVYALTKKVYEAVMQEARHMPGAAGYSLPPDRELQEVAKDSAIAFSIETKLPANPTP
jgi:hypothetical protein